MSARAEIICIGSVLWDMIGRAPSVMTHGADTAGRITRLPGGVAMNVATALAGHGMRCILLSALGNDPEGRALVAHARALGLNVDHLHLSDMPTDRYMAIEGENGLIAAIADARSLEAAGGAILAPLMDGRLASTHNPWSGMIALDGNLTAGLLAEIARGAAFARADLRVAPASPGKAARLKAFLGHERATLYVNLLEAGILLGNRPRDAAKAAAALHARGARRVLVTDGPRAAALVGPEGLFTATPPPVTVHRVTGAGDSLMAAHMVAELRGLSPGKALVHALGAAARHVSQSSTEQAAT